MPGVEVRTRLTEPLSWMILIRMAQHSWCSGTLTQVLPLVLHPLQLESTLKPIKILKCWIILLEFEEI
jgi:hypothetical protein